jgi:hypothetical protein
MDDAHVAQPVEHFLGKEEVTGSIPVVGFHISGEPVAHREGQWCTVRKDSQAR